MVYDVAIIGGGPAGLTAGIYSSLAGHSTVIIEKYMYGGQITLSHEVKNYPSYVDIDGTTLAMQMMSQAKSCGVEMRYEELINFNNLKEQVKEIITNKGTIKAKTIILAMGAKSKRLGVDGEEKFTGRGVSYCAVCDGSIYKGKNMAVIGGGNSAFEDAIYLSDLANKVYLVHYKNTYKSNDDLQKRVLKLAEDGKVEILTPYQVKQINGDKSIENILIKNTETNEIKPLSVGALFIAIGREPETMLLKEEIKTDEYGYIITDENMCTSIKGVYACGDIRSKMLRQVITACSDGAIASTSAHKYITEN